MTTVCQCRLVTNVSIAEMCRERNSSGCTAMDDGSEVIVYETMVEHRSRLKVYRRSRQRLVEFSGKQGADYRQVSWQIENSFQAYVRL